KRRRDLACRYEEKLKPLGWVEPPFVPSYAAHPYQTYATLLKPEAPVDRDTCIQRLAEQGVSSRRGIPPIHKEPYIVNRFGAGKPMPVTEDVSKRTLILPLYPQMTDAEQNQVVAALKAAGG